MTRFTPIKTPVAEKPATAVDAAVQRLKRAIMYGQFVPGQKLIEASLCRELSISRPSLREALRVLESERLIELVPNYGPRVSLLEAQDVREIQEVWSMLTGQAAQRFARIATAADLKAVETAYDQVGRIVESGTSIELLSASNDFFRTMVDRCGNRTLFDVIFRLSSRINFLRAQVVLHHRVEHQYIEELSEIVEALRARNPSAARKAAERHIASVCQAAEQMLLSVGTAIG
jgi:DNA-binding GntR family transcriptional regulator